MSTSSFNTWPHSHLIDSSWSYVKGDTWVLFNSNPCHIQKVQKLLEPIKLFCTAFAISGSYFVIHAFCVCVRVFTVYFADVRFFIKGPFSAKVKMFSNIQAKEYEKSYKEIAKKRNNHKMIQSPYLIWLSVYLSIFLSFCMCVRVFISYRITFICVIVKFILYAI